MRRAVSFYPLRINLPRTILSLTNHSRASVESIESIESYNTSTANRRRKHRTKQIYAHSQNQATHRYKPHYGTPIAVSIAYLLKCATIYAKKNFEIVSRFEFFIIYLHYYLCTYVSFGVDRLHKIVSEVEMQQHQNIELIHSKLFLLTN